MKYLLSLILLISLNASSASLYLGMMSTHFTWKTQCGEVACEVGEANTNHNLIMFEHKGYEIGTFTNSYFEKTIIVAKRFEFNEWHNLRASVHVGADHGYTKCVGARDGSEGDAKICPRVMIEINYTRFKTEPAIFFFGNGVALSFRNKF